MERIQRVVRTTNIEFPKVTFIYEIIRFVKSSFPDISMLVSIFNIVLSILCQIKPECAQNITLQWIRLPKNIIMNYIALRKQDSIFQWKKTICIILQTMERRTKERVTRTHSFPVIFFLYHCHDASATVGFSCLHAFIWYASSKVQIHQPQVYGNWHGKFCHTDLLD